MVNLFSHSRINCFKQCPMLYKYKYVDKLVPLDYDSKALSMGKAFHYGVEQNSSDKAGEYMDEDSFFLNEDGETNKVIVMAMIDAYLNKFPNNDLMKHELHLTGKLLPRSTEDDFQLYIDIVEEDPNENGYWLIELKTASQINDGYIKKLDFIDQPNRYYYFLEKTLDKPILGIKYRVVKKPLLRQKKDESLIQFRQRLVERLSEPDNIYEFVLYRTKEQIRETIKDTQADMRLIKKTKRFTKNLSGCSSYGICPYIELCQNIEGAENLFIRKDDVDEPTGEQESD